VLLGGIENQNAIHEIGGGARYFDDICVDSKPSGKSLLLADLRVAIGVHGSVTADAGDAEQVVLHGNLHVLGQDAWEVHGDVDAGRILLHIDGGMGDGVLHEFCVKVGETRAGAACAAIAWMLPSLSLLVVGKLGVGSRRWHWFRFHDIKRVASFVAARGIAAAVVAAIA